MEGKIGDIMVFTDSFGKSRDGLRLQNASKFELFQGIRRRNIGTQQIDRFLAQRAT